MPENNSSYFEITVPELGESIVDATIIHWLKAVGDPIEAGDAVVELETSKVNLEVSATQAGTLQQILHKENEDVKVGETLALLSPKGSASPISQKPSPAAEKQLPGSEQQAPAPVKQAPNEPVSVQDKQKTPSKPDGATPVARRMAKDEGVDLTNIEGTGPGGRVDKSDVIHYLTEKSNLPAPTTTGSLPTTNPDRQIPVQTQAANIPTNALPVATIENRREERIKMSRRRRTIAESLIQAQQNAAMLTTFNELDMTRVMDLRARRNEALLTKFGVKLGIVSFFIKAAIGALKANPQMNAEIQGTDMVIKHYYDIGIAVANPGGLVVPVVRDADHLSLIEIERRVRDFAEKAEKGTLTLDDLKGGTFSITNGGIFGSLMSTPILTYPQVGILGLHKIEKRPVVVNDEIVIRPMMYAALTYDHRIVDGELAVKFLSHIKMLIEDPETMFLEA